MQTFTQVFAGAQTWQLNVPGNYFILLGATNPVNIRFFKQGKKLNLGDITAVLPGLQAGPFRDVKADGIAFDRVEVDTTAADTITLGIGDGSVTYNRSQGSVLVTSGTINIQDKNGNSIDSAPASGQVLLSQRELISMDGGFGYGASQKSTGVLVSAGSETVFGAGSNVNGAIVWDADVATANGTGSAMVSLHAHTAAPVAFTDGDVLLSCVNIFLTAAGIYAANARLAKAVRVPAGKGVFWLNSGAVTETTARRRVLYTLL